MKCLKLSLAVIVILFAATKAIDAKGNIFKFYSKAWFEYTGDLQNASAYNNRSNYTAITSPSACTDGALLCQIQAPITYDSHGNIVPVLPLAFGTLVSVLNGAGTIITSGEAYAIDGIIITIDFTD